MIADALYSSNNPDWQTPDEILDCVRAVSEDGRIELDPCTVRENPTGAVRILTPDEDGLSVPWHTSKTGLVYVNPPYGRGVIDRWTRKAVEELASGRAAELVLLLPARTDTACFHRDVFPYASALAFVSGRLRFRGAPAGAPFPSVLCYFGAYPGRFRTAFEELSAVVDL